MKVYLIKFICMTEYELPYISVQNKWKYLDKNRGSDLDHLGGQFLQMVVWFINSTERNTRQ